MFRLESEEERLIIRLLWYITALYHYYWYIKIYLTALTIFLQFPNVGPLEMAYFENQNILRQRSNWVPPPLPGPLRQPARQPFQHNIDHNVDHQRSLSLPYNRTGPKTIELMLQTPVIMAYSSLTFRFNVHFKVCLYHAVFSAWYLSDTLPAGCSLSRSGRQNRTVRHDQQ